MSTVEDIVKEGRRARILCVGRSGVGKSSLINRILGLQLASVSHYDVGEANIESEFTSNENNFLVLHDSRGFEPGDTQSFDIVAGFIKRRSGNCQPKDRLHAVWLCAEHPISGGYTFDPSDEKLLQLANETQTPVMIVITKYDRIVKKKRAEAAHNNNDLDSNALDQLVKEKAQKAYDECVQSLNSARDEPLLCMKVSIYPGHSADVSLLVDVTGDLVHKNCKDDAWVLWAIAQRASLRVTLDASAFAIMAYHRRDLAGSTPDSGRIVLRDFLTNVHQDIITCWNIKDENGILSSEEFKRFILLLVQDVEESRNQDQSPFVSSQAIVHDLTVITGAAPLIGSVFTLPDSLEESLSDPVSGNKAQAQCLLMTYAVDLTTLLRSLFGHRPRDEPGLTWLHLKGAYENSAESRQKTHRQICATFRQDQQILDPNRFEPMYVKLLNGEDLGSLSAEDARVLGPQPSAQRPSGSLSAYFKRLLRFRSGS